MSSLILRRAIGDENINFESRPTIHLLALISNYFSNIVGTVVGALTLVLFWRHENI